MSLPSLLLFSISLCLGSADVVCPDQAALRFAINEPAMGPLFPGTVTVANSEVKDGKTVCKYQVSSFYSLDRVKVTDACKIVDGNTFQCKRGAPRHCPATATLTLVATSRPSGWQESAQGGAAVKFQKAEIERGKRKMASLRCIYEQSFFELTN
ncbi:MAG: hypothetical protein HY074_17660 [Deltaproteobacteria bacterium]|nr:hypothetical protein [Deltaproteobacteria bacterium]